MGQNAAPFEYAFGENRDSVSPSPPGASASIFADRSQVRGLLSDLAGDAGMQVRHCADVAPLRGETLPALGEILIIDVPIVDDTLAAVLARLGQRAARGGEALILSTSANAIDTVYGMADWGDAQILVNPSDAERAMALAVAATRAPGQSVGDIASEDRAALMRLTEQVSMLVRRIEGRGDEGFASENLAKEPDKGFIALTPRHERATAARDNGTLPPAGLIREIIRQRQLRAKFFDSELFADPAWDILLDLTAAQSERTQVSVSSLCIAANVPPTTALRWISQMTEAGLLKRVQDRADRRRAFIALSDKSVAAMSAYFAALRGSSAVI
ncbi:winged helix DNA-binding protein [Croceicoccus hydrothermalis]|uniref:winged helix DNA-binding protein n=1 Tax=Croceicoccus hydrothermalis TaxID=2867964 RepID=UPI001EFBBA10|nr:winged helix DNA-binding protein [Croceicoccus hydrothermalis]